MRCRLLLIIVSSIIVSCDNRKSIKSKDFTNLTRDSLLSKHLINETSALSLIPIHQGVDSLEIRIWKSWMRWPRFLSILNYEDSSWPFRQFVYWGKYNWKNGSPDKLVVDSVFVTTLPFSDINKLMQNLNNFKFDEIPDQNEIPGFINGIADGESYAIEIATNRYYRALNYSNPWRYQDTFNKKMSVLLSYLDSSKFNLH